MRFLVIIMVMVSALGCSSPWVKPAAQAELKEQYQEGKVYKLKKDIVVDTRRKLNKGTKVRIFFRFDPDWVKVYAYPHDQERVKVMPILAVYLIKDDLAEKPIRETLNQKLQELFQPAGS